MNTTQLAIGGEIIAEAKRGGAHWVVAGLWATVTRSKSPIY